MLWGRCSTRRGYRHSGFFVAAVIIFVIAVASTRSFMPFIPIFLLLFVILPAARREQATRKDTYEKPKNDFEKPKRSGRYVESEDGTLLEVIDEQPTDRDDTDYV
jgi:hypothetical protein